MPVTPRSLIQLTSIYEQLIEETAGDKNVSPHPDIRAAAGIRRAVCSPSRAENPNLHPKRKEAAAESL
ncbi:hypothetical protein FBR01_03120 [Anaerolineae bacterium CFX8]|nr:hypothetical protein [Anaerolineae bacterium CFX8]